MNRDLRSCVQGSYSNATIDTRSGSQWLTTILVIGLIVIQWSVMIRAHSHRSRPHAPPPPKSKKSSSSSSSSPSPPPGSSGETNSVYQIAPYLTDLGYHAGVVLDGMTSLYSLETLMHQFPPSRKHNKDDQDTGDSEDADNSNNTNTNNNSMVPTAWSSERARPKLPKTWNDTILKDYAKARTELCDLFLLFQGQDESRVELDQWGMLYLPDHLLRHSGPRKWHSMCGPTYGPERYRHTRGRQFRAS